VRAEARQLRGGGRNPVAGQERLRQRLIFFVLTLLKRVQGLVSVPAIVYEEYSRVLETTGAESEEG
jgi:hypothetical protein